jgi:hypothetical protein
VAALEEEDVPARYREARRRAERRLAATTPGPWRLEDHWEITQLAGTVVGRSWGWIRWPAGIGMGGRERGERKFGLGLG